MSTEALGRRLARIEPTGNDLDQAIKRLSDADLAASIATLQRYATATASEQAAILQELPRGLPRP